MFEDMRKALYSYQEDILIRAKGEDEYAVQKYHAQQGWRPYDRLLNRQEINEILADFYEQIPSSVRRDAPFLPQWLYRLMLPEWSVFKHWLIVWYGYEEIKNTYGTHEQGIYRTILEALEKYTTEETLRFWLRYCAEISPIYREVLALLSEYKLYMQRKENKLWQKKNTK